MSDIAIRAEGLGKMYRIGGPRQKYRTIRETLVDTAKMPFQRMRNVMRGEAAGGGHESFWALNDVSFEVKEGEVIGIIGHNGAGKSTLLKILSRITEPSAGYVDVYGRVGALLEVGTGFHPELTGRENIYLNGAILGMNHAELNRKFDEIVDFAGIEKFIDTPVKHYSSGMGLRLGFAVAAHLEPEILVVDEVLAVGDANFQKKCLSKMGSVASEGRTVLFVSHNLAAVNQLCQFVMWLSNGHVQKIGPTQDITGQYIFSATSSIGSGKWIRDKAKMGKVSFQSVSIKQMNNGDIIEDTSVVTFDQPFIIEISYEVDKLVENLEISIGVDDLQGLHIFEAWSSDSLGSTSMGEVGTHKLACTIPSHLLSPDTYNLKTIAFVPRMKGGLLDAVNPALNFTVSEQGFYNSMTGRYGVIAPRTKWQFE